MKLSTLIFTTACLLAISSASFANTGFISLKSAVAIKAETNSSIKFNLLGIATGKVRIKMYNEPKGNYTVLVINAERNILGTRKIEHKENNTIETVDFGKTFTEGKYTIIVLDSNNQKVDETTMLLM